MVHIEPLAQPVNDTARAVLQGTVRDAATRMPLGAVVKVTPLRVIGDSVAAIDQPFVVATSETGLYRLSIPAGTYGLAAARVGHFDGPDTISVRAGEVRTYDVLMDSFAVRQRAYRLERERRLAQLREPTPVTPCRPAIEGSRLEGENSRLYGERALRDSGNFEEERWNDSVAALEANPSAPWPPPPPDSASDPDAYWSDVLGREASGRTAVLVTEPATCARAIAGIRKSPYRLSDQPQVYLYRLERAGARLFYGAYDPVSGLGTIILNDRLEAIVAFLY